MSNLRDFNDNGPYLPVEQAKSLGTVVYLVEDTLDGEQDPPLHVTTAKPVEAALCVRADEMLPAIVLADGHVVVLTWHQMFALREAFTEFSRVVLPELIDKHGPARACVSIPQ